MSEEELEEMEETKGRIIRKDFFIFVAVFICGLAIGGFVVANRAVHVVESLTAKHVASTLSLHRAHAIELSKINNSCRNSLIQRLATNRKEIIAQIETNNKELIGRMEGICK